MKNKILTFGIVVLLITSIFLVNGCGGGGTPQEKEGTGQAVPEPTQQETQEEPEELTLQVGETAHTSKLEVTVKSAEIKKAYTYTSMGYRNTQTAPEGKEYLIPSVEFKNVGEDSQYISSGDFSVVDSENYKYDTGMYLGEEESLAFKELYPGDKTKGKILFEVPADATNLTIRYNFGFMDVELANWEVQKG